jgi:hypothetical protein
MDARWIFIGTAPDLETAKARFKEAWLAFKTRHGPEQLAEAFRATTGERSDRRDIRILPSLGLFLGEPGIGLLV